jgi:hypothetical protein
VFDGTRAEEALQVPEGRHCGVSLQAERFSIRLDEGDPVATTVLAEGFELSVAARFDARGATRHVLRFGDPDWVALLAEIAGPGENVVDGSDPALDAVFFDGLARSSVEDADPSATPTTLAPDLSGRVDIATWPVSPRGTPATFDGCGPNVNYDLALPVPPAAMSAAGLGTDVGWCEANVLFSDDLTPQTATQTDFRTGSLYEVPYNGFSQGCGAIHCGVLYSASGTTLGRPCSVLALCDGAGLAAVTGFEW